MLGLQRLPWFHVYCFVCACSRINRFTLLFYSQPWLRFRYGSPNYSSLVSGLLVLVHNQVVRLKILFQFYSSFQVSKSVDSTVLRKLMCAVYFIRLYLVAECVCIDVTYLLSLKSFCFFTNNSYQVVALIHSTKKSHKITGLLWRKM